MMIKIAISAAYNAAVAAVFVWLAMGALQAQLEETFVALALINGLVSIAGNAALAWWFGRR